MRKGIGLLFATLVVLLSGADTALERSPVGAAQAADRVAMLDGDSDAMKWRFEPADITVPVGSTVVWRNDGNQPHTVTADDGSFDSPYLTAGQEWERSFSAPGEFAYYCEPHPWMKAVVRVVAPAGQDQAPSPAPPEAPSQPAPAPSPPPANPTPAPPAANSSPQTAAAPAPAGQSPAPTSTTTTTTAAAEPTPNATPATTPDTSAEAAPAAGSTGTAADEANEEAAAAETSGQGSGSEDYNKVAIGFALASTLICMAISMKLLLAKP